MVNLSDIYHNARERLYEFARSMTPSLPSPKGFSHSKDGDGELPSSESVSSEFSSHSLINQEMDLIRVELESILNQLREMGNNHIDKKTHNNKITLPTPGDYLPLRRRLGEIDSFYHEGRFIFPGMDKHDIPQGQAQLASLLHEAHTLLEEKLEKTDYYRVSPALRSYHDRLINIISAVKFTIESKKNVLHSLHPSDLYHYRQKLAEIDEHYQQSRFIVNEKEEEEEKVKQEVKEDWSGESKVVIPPSSSPSLCHCPHSPIINIPEGQAIIAELFEEAYDLIHQGLFATDYYKIVDQDLLRLHDKLDDYIVNFTRILKQKQYNNNSAEKMMTLMQKESGTTIDNVNFVTPPSSSTTITSSMIATAETTDKKKTEEQNRFLAKYERHLEQIHQSLVNEYTTKDEKNFDQEGYDIVMDLYKHATHLFEECLTSL